MNAHVFCLATAFALLSFNSPALGADHRGDGPLIGAHREAPLPGAPVTRVFRGEDGNEVTVTVTPPEDRAVDLRFFAALEIDRSLDGDGEAERLRPLLDQLDAEVDLDTVIDVTGYQVQVDPAAHTACAATYYIKSSKYYLAAGGSYYVYSSTPEYMSGTAYPTSGNVNVYVYTNNGSTLCASSTRGSGYLDHAGCIQTNCTNSSDKWWTYIKNASTSSSAYFVGVVEIVTMN